MTFETIAEGLMFPEGPVVMADGTVYVVEIAGGTLARISIDDTVERVATLGGGPNGAALGPDGRMYICNNGGMSVRREGSEYVPLGLEVPDYSTGGGIDRVNLSDGTFEHLYRESSDAPLYSPNDIVFDRAGGFWFTDFSKLLNGKRTSSSLHYATTDGSGARCVFRGEHSFNGVGLSPDEQSLFVADTWSGMLLRFALAGPGMLATPDPVVLCTTPGERHVDSLAVGAAGEVYLAGLMPGGILTIRDGAIVADTRLPDPYVTNIAFGGADLASAYISLSQSGRLVRVQGLGPGLALNFGS